MPRNDLIQIRQGTQSQWSFTNPVLESGEPGYATDTRVFKIGDGVNGWNSLPTPASGTTLNLDNLYIGVAPDSNKVNLLNKFIIDGDSFIRIYADNGGYIAGEDASIVNWKLLNGSIENCTIGAELPNSAKFTSISLDNNIGNIFIQNDNGGLRIDVGTENYLLAPTFAVFDVDYFSTNSGTFTALTVGNTPVSLVGHSHTISDIVNFASGISGFVRGTGIGSSSSGFIPRWINGSGLSNSKIYQKNNNIGIGYTDPGYELQVLGTIVGDSGIFSRLDLSSAVFTSDDYIYIDSHNLHINTETNYANFYNKFFVSGSDVSVSGNLKVNGTGVSLVGHTHSVSDITNFGSGVSGLISNSNISISGSGNIEVINNSGSYVIGVTGLQLTGSYVSLTGTESISGTKTFLNNVIATGQFSSASGYFKDYLSLNGTGVSITGHTHQIYEINNLQNELNNKQPTGLYVSLTGTETISGSKTFSSAIIATGSIFSPTGIFGKLISNTDFEVNGTMNINAAASILASGPITFVGNPYIVSGAGYFTSGLFVGSTGNAMPVSVSGHRQPYSTIDNFCTGVAECVNTPLLAGTGIILSFVSGTGLFIHFSGSSNYVSSTGNETISGIKTFNQQIVATGGLTSVSGYFKDYLALNGTGVSITGHTHQIYQVINLQTELNNKHPTGVYVSLTGIENVSGSKTFSQLISATGGISSVSGYFKDYLALNGTGVSITGHTHQIYEITNLQTSLNNKQPTGIYVSLTGIENISGAKTFSQSISATGGISSVTGYFKDYLALNGTGVSITGHIHQIYEITNLQNELNNKQPTGLYISLTGVESISGAKTFTQPISATGGISAISGYFKDLLQLNGTGVLHTGIFDITNIVRITGNQTITGNKKFGGSTTTIFTTGAKVGIGLESPAYLLDIYDDNLFSPLRTRDSLGNYISFGPPEDGTSVIRLNSNDRIYLTTNNGDIRLSGTVAINNQSLFNATLGSATNGQLLIGNGSTFSKSGLIAGTGINIVNGSGNITIHSNILNNVTGTGTGSSLSGYLPRWNSISNLINSSIYENSGSIGIGTTKPTGKFDVIGSVNLNNLININNTNAIIENPIFNKTSNEYLSFIYDSITYSRTNGGYNTYYGTNNWYVYWDGNGSVWNLNDDLDQEVIYDFFAGGGNVSGTTYLFYNDYIDVSTISCHKFSVTGLDLTYGGQPPSILLKGYAWYGSADGTCGIGAVLNTAGTFGSSTNFFGFQGFNENVTQYNPICLASNYSAQIFLNTDGNVGINTTSPGYKLDVNGTANIATSLRVNAETANTIASFDTSKNIVSLSTSTYPSLTELSYVKGVTSAIQTQLNSKQATLTNPVVGTGSANHIAYWTASNTIAHDNASLYWDATNNRLGINTSSPTVAIDANDTTLRLRTARTISTSNSTGAVGEICWDSNYIYVCVATNTWKRASINTW